MTTGAEEQPEYFRAYYVSREAWYARSDMRDDVMVAMSAAGGGCKWEFAIEQVGDIGLQVQMFHDAWDAWEEISDFFAALAALGESGTLPKVREVLDALGFRDVTDREAPAGYEVSA